MSDYIKTLGIVVRNARIQMKLTQNDVADRINVDNRTILNIENQRGNPKLEVLYPLIRELKIDPNHIFYPELEQDANPDLLRLQALLSQCSINELHALLPMCETFISVMRSSNGFPLNTKQ